MNDKLLKGLVIFVDPAKPREPKPQISELGSSGTGFRTNRTFRLCAGAV